MRLQPSYRHGFNTILTISTYRRRLDPENRTALTGMWNNPARRQKQNSLMQRYGDQMGHLIRQDLTQRALIAAKQEAERSARTAREALIAVQAANLAKTTFLANMSHELRTPLNAVIGFSEIIHGEILGPIAETPRYRLYAKDINDAGSHLLAVINDILDIARIESGQLAISDGLFDCTESIEACIKMLRNQAESGGLLPIGFDHGGPITIRADEQKFRQIMINLISNAIKFTPEDGRVMVTAGLLDDGRLSIVVSDNGIGINPQDIPRALAAFSQVENTLARKYEGAGLGLPITKALVEAHGGTLDLQSQLGEGTRVSVLLPADRIIEPGRND